MVAADVTLDSISTHLLEDASSVITLATLVTESRPPTVSPANQTLLWLELA
jgi:hypothetical protein